MQNAGWDRFLGNHYSGKKNKKQKKQKNKNKKNGGEDSYFFYLKIEIIKTLFTTNE